MREDLKISSDYETLSHTEEQDTQRDYLLVVREQKQTHVQDEVILERRWVLVDEQTLRNSIIIWARNES